MQRLSVILALALVPFTCLAQMAQNDPSQEVDSEILKVLPQTDENSNQPALDESNEAVGKYALRQILKDKYQSGKDVKIPEAAYNLGLKTLVRFLEMARLKTFLNGKGPFTLFGPTDEAFTKLPEWAKEAITKNTTILADVLKFHVLASKVNSSVLTNNLLAETALGEKLRINIYKNASVYTAQCAPLDLTRVNKPALNGIIHVLNGVMLPPAGNIVTALSMDVVFNILVKCVKEAGLVETLSGDGPFTVFAPTNNAFAKLPPGTIQKLLNNPELLAKILKYHVVAGTFCSSGLESGSVNTVEGQDVKVTVSAGGVMVNSAKVVYADVSVTNGVVHVIDTVLIPPTSLL
ncbi:fasciclin domain containing protein [Plakobranchus ocellatus]|uniref:Fasciclin domain containing protein n=1 Tax=Plakobranchus ocellatus TaxID=259542 RepID=A0AAV4D492_9GAST|nr:fasciclin domain containing protein [Plakobranchus ocellatus]